MLKYFSFGVDIVRSMIEVKEYLKDHTFSETEDKIIEANDARLSREFCYMYSEANIKAHEKIIIDSNNPRQYYNFAKVVKGADVKTLKEKAFSFKNVDVMILFAASFPQYGIDKEQEFIINLNDPKYACEFATYVKSNIDVESLQKIVMQSDDYKLIHSFAANVESKNVKELEDVIIASNDALYIYYFARDVKGANKERLLEKLLNLRNLYVAIEYSANIGYIDYETFKNTEFIDEKSKELIYSEDTYKYIIKKAKIN